MLELSRATILAVLLVFLLRADRGLILLGGPGWQLRHLGFFLMMLGWAVEGIFPEPGVRLACQWTLTAGVALLALGFGRRLSWLADMSAREAALQRSQEQYRLLVENQADFLMRLDGQGRMVFVSPALRSLFGEEENDLLGLDFVDKVAPADREIAAKALEDTRTGAPSMQAELRLAGLFGQRLVHWVFTPARLPDGSRQGAVGVGRDITDARAAQQIAHRTANRFQGVARCAPMGLLLFTRKGKSALTLSEFNPAAQRLLRRDLATLMDKTLDEVFPGKGHPDVARAFARVFSSGDPYSNGHLEYHETDFTGIFSLKAFSTGTDELAVFFEDVTERERLESQLENLALFDNLTGLPNRTLFLDRLTRALQRRSRKPSYQVALLFIDLDRFKTVNDSLGHPGGDEVLREAAARIQGCVRSLDTAARLGGDEFVVLLEEFDNARIPVKVLKRVRSQLGEPIRVMDRELALGASIGLALALGKDDTPEDLLRKSEMAMSRAKERGRNRFMVFTDRLLRQTERRVRLEQDMDKALERQEFHLVYQPVVRLEDGRLTGFETLVRWDHPELGRISPVEFIPLAEESGKIVPLDRFILRQACRTFMNWRKRFPQARDLSLSVNLSAKHVPKQDFTAQVMGILADTGMPADQLKLEITETSLMLGGSEMVRKLEQLREKGVRLSIDDFGTGYSSMAYLNRLPVDDLKLDIQFVRHLESRMETREIVRAILALAQGLGLCVVAEGVEMTGQRDTLKDMGCQMAQGFLIARPMSAGQVEEMYFAGPLPAPPTPGAALTTS